MTGHILLGEKRYRCPICNRPIADAAYNQFGMHPWCLPEVRNARKETAS
jgi:hypothetical protein